MTPGQEQTVSEILSTPTTSFNNTIEREDIDIQSAIKISSLTLGVHAPEGYGTYFVCVCVCVCVCLCVCPWSAKATKHLYSILNLPMGFLLSVEDFNLQICLKGLLLGDTAFFALFDMTWRPFYTAGAYRMACEPESATPKTTTLRMCGLGHCTVHVAMTCQRL